MSSPLMKLMRVRSISVVSRAARPFATTHRQPGHARFTGVFLPHAVDAALTSRSGFAGRAVGGVFLG